MWICDPFLINENIDMENSICGLCDGLIVLDALSESECIHCGKHIVSPHIPPNKVCDHCSSKFNVCTHCGISLTNNNFGDK